MNELPLPLDRRTRPTPSDDPRLIKRRLWREQNKERLAKQRKAWLIKHKKRLTAERRKKRKDLESDPKALKAYRIKKNDWEKRSSRIQKVKFLNMYGTQCSCCGETEFEFLSLDHIHGNGGKHREETGTSKLYRLVIKEYRPDLYRVLCFNCNRSAYLGKGICIHKRQATM